MERDNRRVLIEVEAEPLGPDGDLFAVVRSPATSITGVDLGLLSPLLVF